MPVPSQESKPIIYIVRQEFVDADTVEIHILGERFGPGQGSGGVSISPKAFDGEPTIVSWTDTKIVATIDFVPEEVRDTTTQGVVQVTTDAGQTVVQSNKQADLYGKKSKPAYTLDNSELIDDQLNFNGSRMDLIEAAVLTEDVTGDEIVAAELNKTPDKYTVRVPESVNGFDSAYLISRNGTSIDQKLAEVIDINTTGPGYVWDLAPQFSGVPQGKGLRISNVPSGLTHAKVTGASSDVAFKPIAAYDPLNNRNLTIEAYYTDPAHTEVLVRWNRTTLNEPIEPTEPWAQVELLDYINAPILVTPAPGDSWEWAPTLTGLVDNGDDTFSITGTQLDGHWAFYIEKGTGETPPAIGAAYDRFTGPENIVVSPNEIVIDKVFLPNRGFTLPDTFDGIRINAFQGTNPIATVSGSWTINP